MLAHVDVLQPDELCVDVLGLLVGYPIIYRGIVLRFADGWSMAYSFFAGSPALADLDDDGYLEVVIPGQNSMLYIFTHTAGYYPGWPKAYASSAGSESSPIVADITGDGNLDIIHGGEEGRLNAWESDGTEIPGFPVTPPFADFPQSFGGVVPVEVEEDEDGIPTPVYETPIEELDLQLTLRCNLSCGFCAVAANEQQGPELDPLRILDIIDQAHSLGLQQLHLTGGEPALRSDLEQVIQHATSLGIALPAAAEVSPRSANHPRNAAATAKGTTPTTVR